MTAAHRAGEQKKKAGRTLDGRTYDEQPVRLRLPVASRSDRDALRAEYVQQARRFHDLLQAAHINCLHGGLGDMDRAASIFKPADKLRIEVGVGFDAFPHKEFVVSGGDVVDLEVTCRIDKRVPISGDPVSGFVGYQHGLGIG